MTLDEITQAAKIAGILKDENVEPMPQTFDPALRKFVPSLSDQGSKRVVLYGPDGQPISTVEGKLAVRAEEIETAISTLQTALAGAGVDAKTLADVVTALDGKSTEAKQDAANTLLTALKGKDYATQTTLAQVLAKMIAAPATEAKQDAANTLLTALKGKDYATQTTLAQVLAKMIAAPATEAKQDAANTLLTALKGKDYATQTTLAQVLAKMIAAPATEAKQDAANTLLTALKGKDYATETKLEAVRVLLNSLAGEDFATSAKQAEILAALGKQSTAEKQDILADLIGAIDAAAVSDPAAAGAVIALLKGLLSRLQTLENKIDSFTTGGGTASVELTGSLIEDEQAVPIRYPAMEKRYTEYDNYVLPAGASIDRSIYEDIKGFRYVNLVLWRDDTTIPVRIQLYSRGLLNEWFNNTIEDIGAGQKTASIIDYPIIPTTCMYVTNMGDTAVTLKGIAIKART
jgi:hypothetical protein